MQLGKRLHTIKARLQPYFRRLPKPYPGCVLFFSLCDTRKKAAIFHVSGKDFLEAWTYGVHRLPLLLNKNQDACKWLRIDLVDYAEPIRWPAFLQMLGEYRRNFFRYGLAFDQDFQYALLEQECNANSLLFGKNKEEKAAFNAKPCEEYLVKRFNKCPTLPKGPDDYITIFSTMGSFCDASDENSIFHLPSLYDASVVPLKPGPSADQGTDAALYTGRRRLEDLSHETLEQVIHSASRFLAGQMQDTGQFIYGYMPGLAARLTGYNYVRHSGTLFALLDAIEHTHDETLFPAIKAGIHTLAEKMIRRYTLPNGEKAAFLVESNGEIKLGGNGVSLVTLCRWQHFSGKNDYLPLMQELAAGLAYMQNKENGTFVHVLNAADLSVKAVKRTVYYDGEALFGLMKIYELTKEEQWLNVALQAFETFISMQHWKHHDHWLSYAANELTLHKPEDRYFQFGLLNVGKHLDFILQRETTYPTLLELAMAAEKMVRRLEAMPDKSHLLREIDLAKFRLATRRRAAYLLNGYFWPEQAMFFHKPYQLAGSFFIRHHAFRDRIDDVGHYLCGLVAYDALFAQNVDENV